MSTTDRKGRARKRYAGAAAICYGLWGAIHVWVGSTVLTKAAGRDPGEALRFLDDAWPQSAPSPLPTGVTPLLQQHGWNLLWIGGTVATIAAVDIWRNRPRGSVLAFALTGLADVGFLGAFVVPGFVRLQTWLLGPALWLAGAALSWIALRGNHQPVSAGTGR